MAIENCLRLTSAEDNNVIALTQTGTPSTVSLEYRTDLQLDWQPYAIGTQLTLQNGSWVEFRNTTGTFSTSSSDYYKFTMTRRTLASGNVNSLLDWTQDDPPLKNYCYCNMFNDCTSLTQAPELPATTLANYCYNSMFNGCTSLTSAPELPATTLADYCCKWMFVGCTSLTKAPTILPATTLVTSCYEYMFQRCNSLTQAPEIPATTVARLCCRNMFDGCTSLTKAPTILPAMTLVNDCYTYMFIGCSSLTQAPELNATTLAGGCYNHLFNGCSKIDRILWKSKTIPSWTYCNDWLGGVSASGTFEYTQPLLDVASITRTTSGVPEGWSIKQLKPEAGGLAVNVNGVDVKTFNLLGKPVAKLSVNGIPVKRGKPAYGPDVEIPSFLSKLQYVSSNGGTLDTGIPTNGNLKVGIKWSKPTSGNSTWPEIFGNSTIGGFSGEYYQAFTFRHNEYSDAKFKYEFYHGLYSPTEKRYGAIVPYQPKIPLDDTIHEFWLGPTEFSFDGNVYNNVDYANQYEGYYNDWEYRPGSINKSNMFLFTSKTGRREAQVNCYNFYIIDTTTNDVLLNYVPCKNGTQAGFFDTVTQTFVYHKSFVAGPAA